VVEPLFLFLSSEFLTHLSMLKAEAQSIITKNVLIGFVVLLGLGVVALGVSRVSSTHHSSSRQAAAGLTCTPTVLPAVHDDAPPSVPPATTCPAPSVSSTGKLATEAAFGGMTPAQRFPQLYQVLSLIHPFAIFLPSFHSLDAFLFCYSFCFLVSSLNSIETTTKMVCSNQ
jgi:hypothetical protein